MFSRIQISTLSLILLASPAAAQNWSPWDGEPFWERSAPRAPGYAPRSGRDATSRYNFENEDFENTDSAQRPQQPLTFNGGGRPYIEPVEPEIVDFPYSYPVRSIVIDNAGKKLYFVTSEGQAYAYPISIGREGFSWTGTEKISRKQEWPDWHPPAEMRKRDPKLPEKMTGGLRNPLGAKALYLGNTLYRIHGTNDPKTIGRASSSGCFRMLNAHVLHLASIADVGTTVTVVMRLPGARNPEVAQLQPARPQLARPRVARPAMERMRVEPDWSRASSRRDLFDDEDTYEYVDGAYRRVPPMDADPYAFEEPSFRRPYYGRPRTWRDPYER